MTAQLQAVEAFRAFAEKTTGQPVSVGLLSTGGKYRSAGRDRFPGVHFPRPREPPGGDFTRCLSKFKKQEQAYGFLCGIANACDTARLGAPVVNAEARSEPLFVGTDGDYWIYSLSVSLRIII